MSPVEAFKRLGCYFGDDSAVAADAFEPTRLVAEECGMKLEKEEVPSTAGPGHVVFLSRVYPDIRSSLASHPCVVRSLKKMCTVQVPPGAEGKTLASKLRLKTEGLLVSDPHVPVLAEYARALNRVYGLEEKSAQGAAWEEVKSTDSRYLARVASGAYPYENSDAELLLASVATELGITTEECQLLMRRLDNAATEKDIYACSLTEGTVELPEWASWVPTVPVAI